MMSARERAEALLEQENQQLVMRAFGRKPNLCIHQLHELTQLDYPELITALARLMQGNKVVRIFPEPTTLGREDRQYMKAGTNMLTADQFSPDRLSPLVGLSEAEMRLRVTMISRMKQRLIVEWHPVLDVLLKDYQRDLKRIELVRDPPDPDEPDVLDRDF